MKYFIIEDVVRLPTGFRFGWERGIGKKGHGEAQAKASHALGLAWWP
jgi:hypothetical protein